MFEAVFLIRSSLARISSMRAFKASDHGLIIEGGADNRRDRLIEIRCPFQGVGQRLIIYLWIVRQ